MSQETRTELAELGPERKAAYVREMALAITGNGGRVPHGLLPRLGREWGLSPGAMTKIRQLARRTDAGAEAEAARRLHKARGADQETEIRRTVLKRVGSDRLSGPAPLVTSAQLEIRRQSMLGECRRVQDLAEAAQDWTAVKGLLALRVKLEGVDRPIPVHVPAMSEAPPEDVEQALTAFWQDIRIERQRAAANGVSSAVGRLIQTEKEVLTQLLAVRGERKAQAEAGKAQPALILELVNVLKGLPDSVLGSILEQVAGSE